MSIHAAAAKFRESNVKGAEKLYLEHLRRSARGETFTDVEGQQFLNACAVLQIPNDRAHADEAHLRSLMRAKADFDKWREAEDAAAKANHAVAESSSRNTEILKAHQELIAQAEQLAAAAVELKAGGRQYQKLAEQRRDLTID